MKGCPSVRISMFIYCANGSAPPCISEGGLKSATLRFHVNAHTHSHTSANNSINLSGHTHLLTLFLQVAQLPLRYQHLSLCQSQPSRQSFNVLLQIMCTARGALQDPMSPATKSMAIYQIPAAYSSKAKKKRCHRVQLRGRRIQAGCWLTPP